MKKIKIVTDSTSDLRKEEIEKYGVEVVYLTALIDGVEYREIDNTEYIYKLREAKNFSTSQPSVGQFMETYEKWTKEGYDIISIHLTPAVSGTYSTAVSVANDYKNVKVIDTTTSSRGMIYFIKDAYKYIQEGKSLDEIYKLLQEKREKVITYVSIDKLDNLVKGGRLKKTVGFMGGLLNLKILTKVTENDELVPIEKVRGKKKLVQAIIDNMKKDLAGQELKTISLVHALSDEYIKLLRIALKEEFGYQIKDEDIEIVTAVISTHVGEGAVGILIELK
ncbi:MULTISPECIES: DegV family protein [unclassified Gemella]|uniref:DegV family protein n=1 Tax=unclassified Gemella TaxID=2624949 RepID=UPI00107307B6|nr:MULTISPECIES: DegV family protein [unclassified Gemella]MBF0710053.1 DegV family protein [Gemella sp. GL1.1]MBF0746132.1 DegV family protein [Gemella sp. 19428wG2_WT2a]NYS27397.1 DegV family protein [Gemella sp. GL1]TFU60421.1 DegV family protein [Gemella sp. WT2a]